MYTVKVTYHKDGRVGTVSFCNNAKSREEALAWAKNLFERTHKNWGCTGINYVVQERSVDGGHSLVFVD